jgi:hypothetical protein
MATMRQLELFQQRDDARIAREAAKQTSHDAADDVRPKLAGLRAEFVRRLRELGRPATANEIAAGDESIRKRAAECVRLGFVKEVGTKVCAVSGKRATVYW